MKTDTLKLTWNLGLLYKNPKDPQIEQDMQEIEKANNLFAKKYLKIDFIKTPILLAKALGDYEKLSEINSGKAWRYFALMQDIDSNDNYANAMVTKIEQRMTEARNKTAFFILRIGQISASQHKKFLTHKDLKPFKYQLEQIFLQSKYYLSEPEEQMLNLLSQTSYDMWVDGQRKVLSQKTVRYKNTDIPLAQARSLISELPKKQRVVLDQKITQVLKDQAPFAEAEINAIFNYKKITDEMRGYKSPTDATRFAHQLDEKTLDTLVNTVTKHFSIAHRFYKIHAKLLGEKKIGMYDRSVTIGNIKSQFDYTTAVDIVRSACNKVDKKYVEIFDTFLKNGQIDVYPKIGKQSGAYCWGGGSIHEPYVLLNHTDNLRNVETLAHEMGHAFHSELSKILPPRYRRYTTATAEVASTFFEQLVSDELLKRVSVQESMYLLHSRILGDVSTVFRQIACYNFEKELHEKIRTHGQLSVQEIAKLLQKHLKSYLGPAVEVTEDDGYFFVDWSHIRNFFYVSSYAYGQLISKAMYQNWKQDVSFSEKLHQFLSAGGSDTPENIFKSIGIDTSKASFWESGLRAIEQEVVELEKMVKKLNK
jgi:oligoendopeptidase F